MFWIAYQGYKKDIIYYLMLVGANKITLPSFL